jgi:hypothetical protein
MLIERLITGSGLILLLSNRREGFLPIGIFSLLGLFIGIKKPYRKAYHNYRQILNMLIAISI